MRPVCYINRGLPGSGKSTRARKMVEAAGQYGIDRYIFSTDDYWFDAFGQYRFNPARLRDAHHWNYNRFERAVEQDAPFIIVDNCNMRIRDFVNYVYLAYSRDYDVEIMEPNTPWAWDIDECFRRCQHGVPREKIAQMASVYEPACLEKVLNFYFSAAR